MNGIWIRTQTNDLINLNQVSKIDRQSKFIFAYQGLTFDNSNYVYLGVYATEKRALEVLNEIQEHIETRVVADKMLIDVLSEEDVTEQYTLDRLKRLSCVYVMPKE